MKSIFLLLGLLLSASSFSSSAVLEQANDLRDQLDLEVEIIPGEEFVGNLEWEDGMFAISPIGASDPQDVDITKIINLGKQAWKFIVKNRPVVNLQTDQANALPAGITSWEGLQGWKDPKSYVIRMKYKNGFGMSVVDFAFRVILVYGGNYEGKGQFIARATIAPAQLDVLWGYTFAADVKVPSTLNAGTKDNPNALMELEIGYSIDTVIKHTQKRFNFFVKGNGELKTLN